MAAKMLHTQITRLNKHKVVFIRKLRAHAFLIFYPTPFVVHELNKTCHALYKNTKKIRIAYRL